MPWSDRLSIIGMVMFLLGLALDAYGVPWAELVFVSGGALAILVALVITFLGKKDGVAF